MENPIKKFLKWLFDLGIKFITKLIRSSAEADGVPKSRLPTERDITWELGYAVLKRVAKAGLGRVKDRVVTTIKSPVTMVIELTEAMRVKKDAPLVIDI